MAAVAICVAAGWLLGVLMQNAERAKPRRRLKWLAGVGLVAGVGVWTTHFMAMLGYRSDIALGYDPLITAASAAIAVVAVGIPLAISAAARKNWQRGLAGGMAGVGVGAMHLSGMAALQGCVQTQSLGAGLTAYLTGAAIFAAARASPRLRNSVPLTCSFITAGVCGAHFIAISGTSLTPLAVGRGMGGAHVVLSVFTAAGAIVLFVGTALAVIAARRFDAQERAYSSTLATALENMSNGILTMTREGKIDLFNDRLRDMLGLEPEDVARGMSIETFFANVGLRCGWDAAHVGRVVDNHYAWLRKETATLVEHVSENGRVISITYQPVGSGAVLTYDDVTRDRQAQKQILDLAFKDPLTGLANRRALQTRMEEGFSSRAPFELLLIDLDRFKFVNDTFGHSVGDRLLQQVATCVARVAGADAFVARLGGDEMAVLVFDASGSADAVAAAIVEAVGKPFVIDETTLVIGASVGLCGADDARTPEELMQRADLALYESKRRGRGRTTRYQSGMLEAVAERNAIENDMREALAKGQFHLVYQPVKSLGHDRIIGFEALIRWQHPTRGAIPPARFIPLAEESGQILAIGKWVLEEACRQAAAWPDDQHVAVNVSPVQLRSPLLLAHVTAALSKSGLAAHRLEVELTETAMVEDGKQIAHVLADLRTLGIKIAMDDFGTGYSSLTHLRDMPLDRIKIDRSFVDAAQTDPHCMAVLKAITQMGRDMRIETLAEGVETLDQLQLLKSLGCDAVQGYFIGKPQSLPGDERLDAGRAA